MTNSTTLALEGCVHQLTSSLETADRVLKKQVALKNQLIRRRAQKERRNGNGNGVSKGEAKD
jgi:hypothetical protein